MLKEARQALMLGRNGKKTKNKKQKTKNQNNRPLGLKAR